jgi:hypothetical protein
MNMTTTAMLANALVLVLFRSMTPPDSEDHRIGEGRGTGTCEKMQFRDFDGIGLQELIV